LNAKITSTGGGFQEEELPQSEERSKARWLRNEPKIKAREAKRNADIGFITQPPS
jgi:hypothetical protein